MDTTAMDTTAVDTTTMDTTTMDTTTVDTTTLDTTSVHTTSVHTTTIDTTTIDTTTVDTTTVDTTTTTMDTTTIVESIVVGHDSIREEYDGNSNYGNDGVNDDDDAGNHYTNADNADHDADHNADHADLNDLNDLNNNANDDAYDDANDDANDDAHDDAHDNADDDADDNANTTVNVADDNDNVDDDNIAINDNDNLVTVNDDNDADDIDDVATTSITPSTVPEKSTKVLRKRVVLDNDDMCNSEEYRRHIIGLINQWRAEMPAITITNDTDIYGEQLQHDVIQQPIVILRDFLRHKRLKLNRISLFNEMVQASNSQNITVLKQDLGVHGWKNISKNTYWEKCTFSDYVLYAKRLEKLLDVASKFCVDVPLSCLDMAILAMTEAEQGHDATPKMATKKVVKKTKAPNQKGRPRNHDNDALTSSDPFVIKASFNSSSDVKPWFSDVSIMLALTKKKKKRDRSSVDDDRRPRLLQGTFVSWPNISRADFRSVNEARQELEQHHERERSDAEAIKKTQCMTTTTTTNTNNNTTNTTTTTTTSNGSTEPNKMNEQTRPTSTSSVYFESTYSNSTASNESDEMDRDDDDDNDNDITENSKREDILNAVLCKNKEEATTFEYHNEIHAFPELPHKRRGTTTNNDANDPSKSQLIVELFVGPRGALCVEMEFRGILLYYSPLTVHDPSISLEGLSRRSRERTLVIVEDCLLEYMTEMHDWLNGNHTEIPGRAIQDELLFLLSNSNGFVDELCQYSEPLSVFDMDGAKNPTKKRTRGSSKSTESVAENSTTSKINGLFRGKITFGSNINLEYMHTYQESLKSAFPSWMMCSSKDDMLKRLRQNVEGMNTPQFYVKVPGVWTGGHEENNRFRSINCNEGPGSSEWFSVESKYFNTVRTLVLADYKVDILRNEGAWFPDPLWFTTKHIPFLHGIQKSGDVVVLKGATLHWVRSLGFATHYSWNIGLFSELDQITSAVERYHLNDELTKTGPAFQNLVPIKSFVLDIVNELLLYIATQNDDQLPLSLKNIETGAKCILDNDKMMFCYIEQLIYAVAELHLLLEDSQKAYDDMTVTAETENSLIVYCDHQSCRREIFEAYMYCKSCKYLCLRCSVDHPCVRNKMSNIHGREIYFHSGALILLKSAPHEIQAKLDTFIEFAVSRYPNLVDMVNECKLKAVADVTEDILARRNKRLAKGFKSKSSTDDSSMKCMNTINPMMKMN